MRMDFKKIYKYFTLQRVYNMYILYQKHIRLYRVIANKRERFKRISRYIHIYTLLHYFFIKLFRF
jgi:hypothetical protein